MLSYNLKFLPELPLHLLLHQNPHEYIPSHSLREEAKCLGGDLAVVVIWLDELDPLRHEVQVFDYDLQLIAEVIIS